MPLAGSISPPIAAQAIAHGEVVFIAVGTPPDEDGSADLQYVLAVARTIGRHIARPTVVVDKSTVPVGTADKVRAAIAAELAGARRGGRVRRGLESRIPQGRRCGQRLHAPRPHRDRRRQPATPIERMKRLYAPFNRNHDRIVVMDVRSAELTKYAANAMLATKISFMNEIANIAERVGADIEQVRHGIGSDPRIGWHFIYPGAGYGGSCFPKDVQALARTAQQHDYDARLLNAVEAVNESQKGHLFELIQRHYDRGEDEGVRGKTFAVWGLSFKPNTDDMRAASSRTPAGAAVGGRRQGARLRSGSLARGDAHLRRARRPAALRFGVGGAGRRRCAGRGDRMEAVPQPGFRPPARRRWPMRSCSTAATCTSRTKSKRRAWRTTASAAADRCMQNEPHPLDQALEQRLVELETRLAFQEHALGELSEALADARAEGNRTSELMRSMLSDLRKVRTELYADAADEPPPPHY